MALSSVQPQVSPEKRAGLGLAPCKLLCQHKKSPVGAVPGVGSGAPAVDRALGGGEQHFAALGQMAQTDLLLWDRWGRLTVCTRSTKVELNSSMFKKCHPLTFINAY